MLKILVTCEKMHMVYLVVLDGLSRHSYPYPFRLGLDSDMCGLQLCNNRLEFYSRRFSIHSKKSDVRDTHLSHWMAHVVYSALTW